VTDTTKNSGSEILWLRQNNAFLEGLVTELRVLLRDANECLSDASYVKAEDKVRYEQLVKFAKEQETEIEGLTQQLGTRDEQVAKLTRDYQALVERHQELKAQLIAYETAQANIPARKKRMPKL
jgi:chromosome segregation ATPase